MPLRDHFEPPYDRVPYDGLHGMWPTRMIDNLFDQLPPQYFVAPQVQLGARLEFDVATYRIEDGGPSLSTNDGAGGVATMIAPPKPTLDLECELPAQDEYEVRIYDHEHGRRLVATVEIVSPSNKDRPENRRAFVAKCAALLQQDVCVSIVDIVTARHSNLYIELLELMGLADPSFGSNPSPIYAVTCRGDKLRRRPHVKTWAHPLAIGQPLPTLPIGLKDDLWITLDLEWSYEQTCKYLGITRLG